MKIESFKRAIDYIERFFHLKNEYAYTLNDLREIFDENREDWKIAAYRNSYDFINFLQESRILYVNGLDGYDNSEKKIWTKEDAVNYDIALTIRKGGYLSNYTAMQIHNLTLQIPKTIYVSIDKYEVFQTKGDIILEQEAVDSAFSNKQRMSTDVFVSRKDKIRYTFLHKKHNSIKVGIINRGRFPLTDLERTLIDITVRPAYSGGVFQVLEAYQRAAGKISLPRLNDYLNKLDYIYPYHQLVGFYLEKSGYQKSELKFFLDQVSNINFYLTYGLTTKKLDKSWKVYYPIGF
ncbi:hypothetical protein [Seonamhaeicola sp.]|uniref:type IV toxin-antitoxin system AbiEi family antitoxin domain-containing protein n=1 Tax=Seonamhaeicola sp. TaxID=1912245 RepID=UPI002639BC78|nr:hypothetical protein [Seonamhaeicola sp.]